ncbi:MAG: NAD(+)/NADH kinase [Bacteroidales bacterium]|nr:NAD(+)/NADH kinase [Bacteroidales bacterium]MBK7626436.1 NAD(+)/NADH kinase [Bacteroidales bacterium]
MLNKVAIYSKDSNPKTREGVSRLVTEFCRRGIKMLIHQKSEDHKICQGGDLIEHFSELSDLTELPEMVLSVGGDGTFLETVLKVKDLEIPIAGVNTGRMGFLANIPAEDISHSIDMLCSGEYEIVERCLLELSRPYGLFEGNASSALNEITVQKADLSMITINVYVDDIHLNTYWCDGLIISTATGSTAYNLSVGGPILSPEDESIIISPIAPHNLTIRPIIISGESRLRMVIEGRSHEYMTTCDFRSARVPFTEEIHIYRAPVKLKTVMLKGRDFYSTLRNKLMWGVDKRN